MSYFFLSEKEKEQKIDKEEYIQIITNHVKKEKLNLLEYSYLTSCLQSSSIIKSDWFIEIINSLQDEK
jgi:hypothetical protein